ncbi:hypothetical protein CA850_29560 [Micromonospora echinospora]|nr:hypothetical protein [Micromonospora echinospora]OZV75000.1 hypothetical protein CA850_29560 [Micromonospora echinospora]
MHAVITRALRRQRITVVGAVVLGLAWGLLVRARSDDGLLTVVPMLLLLVGSGVVLFRGPSRAALRVDPDAVVTYAPPRAPAPFAAFAVAWLCFQLVRYGGERELGLFRWLLVVGSMALVVFVVVDRWRQVPMVDLSPEGVGFGRPRRTFFVPWSALAAGQPILPTAQSRALRLVLARPELVSREGGRRRRTDRELLPTHDVDVAPDFLAAAIRHYLDHPAHRPAIGTVAEHARLCRALSGE